MKIVPPAYASPRFTVSQHAIGTTCGSCFGTYFHLTGAPSFVRSSAYTISGNGVWTYIMLPITNGPPSCPRRTPVENVQETLRFLMLSVLIELRVLYRVDA